jgi:hypothetical protein
MRVTGILLLSMVLLAAGSIDARLEALEWLSRPDCHDGGVCLSGKVSKASVRHVTWRGYRDPNCRYKCTFCGPIKTCATFCR